MKKLFSMLAVLLLVMAVAHPVHAKKAKKASGKAVVFEAEEFNTPEKIAAQSEKFIDVSGGKYLKKYNVKKVGVVEFYVEFLQSREIQQSAYESQYSGDAITSGSSLFGPRKLKTEGIKFSGDYYRDAVLMLYDAITGQLTKDGFTFLPKDEVANDPGYKKLELATEVEGGGFRGGVFQRGETTKTVMLSADGLGVFPEHMGVGGTFAAIGKARPIQFFKVGLAKEKGLDAVAQVYIFIDKGEDGAPLINTFNMVFDIGPDNSDPNNPYMKEAKGTMIKLSKPLVSGADISGTGKNSVDTVKYNTALFEMVDTIAKMAGVAMQEAMK